jgi:hypothetical protein
MKQKYYLFAVLVVVLSMLILSGCIKKTAQPDSVNTTNSSDSGFVKAKLIGVNGGEFVQSAGYYEGTLQLVYGGDGTYSFLVCSNSWNWVKKGSCYRFNPEEVYKNIELNKQSSELSGCYVGTLDRVDC